MAGPDKNLDGASKQKRKNAVLIPSCARKAPRSTRKALHDAPKGQSM